MNIFKVQVTRTKVETVTVEVPADSDRQAIQRAISDASWEDADAWAEMKAPEYETKVLGVSGP